ncbi:MAG: four helix bundle protein [Acidobacteria bacterium]|nr:four helix bundle protein [Acidobacteriota bacterium]
MTGDPGCGSTGIPELRRCCRIALGSASELEYHFLLARDLGFLPPAVNEDRAGQVVEVKHMLAGIIGRLQPVAGGLMAES